MYHWNGSAIVYIGSDLNRGEGKEREEIETILFTFYELTITESKSRTVAATPVSSSRSLGSLFSLPPSRFNRGSGRRGCPRDPHESPLPQFMHLHHIFRSATDPLICDYAAVRETVEFVRFLLLPSGDAQQRVERRWLSLNATFEHCWALSILQDKDRFSLSISPCLSLAKLSKGHSIGLIFFYTPIYWPHFN